MLIIAGRMMTFLHSFMQTDPPGGDNIPIDIQYMHTYTVILIIM